MKTPRQQLWVALVALALGATLLHFRIHPPKDTTFFGPISSPGSTWCW